MYSCFSKTRDPIDNLTSQNATYEYEEKLGLTGSQLKLSSSRNSYRQLTRQQQLIHQGTQHYRRLLQHATRIPTPSRHVRCSATWLQAAQSEQPSKTSQPLAAYHGRGPWTRVSQQAPTTSGAPAPSLSASWKIPR